MLASLVFDFFLLKMLRNENQYNDKLLHVSITSNSWFGFLELVECSEFSAIFMEFVRVNFEIILRRRRKSLNDFSQLHSSHPSPRRRTTRVQFWREM